MDQKNQIFILKNLHPTLHRNTLPEKPKKKKKVELVDAQSTDNHRHPSSAVQNAVTNYGM